MKHTIETQTQIEKAVIQQTRDLTVNNIEAITRMLADASKDNYGSGEIVVKLTFPISVDGSEITVDAKMEYERKIKGKDEAAQISFDSEQPEFSFTDGSEEYEETGE